MISQLGTNGDRRDRDFVQNSYNFSPSSTTSTNLSPPSLIAFTDLPDASTRPQPLPDSPDLTQSSPNQLRKPRKEKQRIELAPDQPPTTQGRRRARVFVACVNGVGVFPCRRLAVLLSSLLAVGARSVVTVRSRCASTAPSVAVPNNVLMMLYRSVGGLIGSREHVLAERSRRKMKNQDAGDAIVRRSNKQPAVGRMALGGQVSTPSPRSPISCQIQLCLAIHSKTSFPFMQ
jgi:hypothetical protein